MFGSSYAGHLEDGHGSLRERKKLATRRALRRVALRLVAERGYCEVTVEDIAEAADVSPRTFFNYFPSKEAALVGADPERAELLRKQILDEPREHGPLRSLCSVLVREAASVAEEVADLGGNPAEWLGRLRRAQVDPHLRAAQAAHMTTIERAIVSALAERLRTDARDPYPSLLAGAAMGVMRAVISAWATSGGTVELVPLAQAAFEALAQGLPEDCRFRSMVVATHVETAPEPRLGGGGAPDGHNGRGAP